MYGTYGTLLLMSLKPHTNTHKGRHKLPDTLVYLYCIFSRFSNINKCVMHYKSVCNNLLHQDNCLSRLLFWNVKPYEWYVGIISLEESAASSIRAEVGSVVTKSWLHISCNSSTTHSPCNAGSLPVSNNMLRYHRPQIIHTDRNLNLKHSKRVSR